MERQHIAAISKLLGRNPLISAKEIARELNEPGLTRSIVNRILYGNRDAFTVIDSQIPPLWKLRAEPETAAYPDDGGTVTVDSTGAPLVPSASDTLIAQPWARTEPETPAQGGNANLGTYQGPPLRAWQAEAFETWQKNNRRGIVEAVTGTGKTAVGIAAIVAAVDDGRRAVVLVPGLDLLQQWQKAIAEAVPSANLEALGGGAKPENPHWDVLIATVQSASRRNIFGSTGAVGALVVADEVHRYGASEYAKALLDDFTWRLGLTATLHRSDNAVVEILAPYFGPVIQGCDYKRAKKDGIIAPVNVVTIGVDFLPVERARYDKASEVCRKAQQRLVYDFGLPEEPYGEFMKHVQQLAKSDFSQPTMTAQRYLKSLQERREVLAECKGKVALVQELPAEVLRSTRSIFFTERVVTAGQVQHELGALGVDVGLLRSGLTPANRTDILNDFRSGKLQAVAAPRVLDEGIDVPDAQLGFILAASRSRRQMIQRMGRIIRPKNNGGRAVFVVAYVKDTTEDPDKGAHETFFNELTTIADEKVTAGPDDLPFLLRDWLDMAPLGSPDSTHKRTPETLDVAANESAATESPSLKPEGQAPEQPEDQPAEREPSLSMSVDVASYIRSVGGIATWEELLENVASPEHTVSEAARMILSSDPMLTVRELGVTKVAVYGRHSERALDTISTWASGPDPVGNLLTVTRSLSRWQVQPERLLHAAAAARGCTVVGLLTVDSTDHK
ncbi:DEAD/DEAH box helicase [Hoyosella rhizosphaerae]|uniref:DEAD/DEAH box helicase n=1 Tax=Hoyosella rhizosphaerae TaxID=1755582 RepID=A0A916XIC1_9ACTN|nr:DEAD/DEAH box helicase [Hoyosella rhizosphaerae]GGC73813.1 hypothetical protein GCM10011410_28720 [Hoyosella rhizosphaerae]